MVLPATPERQKRACLFWHTLLNLKVIAFVLYYDVVLVLQDPVGIGVAGVLRDSEHAGDVGYGCLHY